MCIPMHALTGCFGASSIFKQLTTTLLRKWCDGMLRTQILNASDTTQNGILACPACDHVHARIIDSVYPFFYMAKASGEQKYLDAGIAAFEWGENVSREDGAWTNDLDPQSWDGTTVFTVIALAETLHYHGDLLDEKKYGEWSTRLKRASEFVYKRFHKIGNANINYGAASIYALHLVGNLFDEQRYTSRSKELAIQIRSYFTRPNYFLFGEFQGNRNRRSAKGLPGIDLGYNLEESLNLLVLYALETDDQELLALVKKSLDTHLKFILPDGGLDNSFGTRMFKWSYWGSRTSDGMQMAFGMLADHNPAFGTAAILNAKLLESSTHDGLLHGGPDYTAQGLKPCVHHTFTHAKSFASLLDHWKKLPKIDTTVPIPRSIADGLDYFEELDTALFARGMWRGTVSNYDGIYNPDNDVRQATGGALALLYHNKVGLLCTASLAVYKMLEANNQQPQPGEDIALTPRIETYRDDIWYTNLFDLTATSKMDDSDGIISIETMVDLKSDTGKIVPESASQFKLGYHCSDQKMEIQVTSIGIINAKTAFVLPIVSVSTEQVKMIDDRTLTLMKPEGLVTITSNTPIRIKEFEGKRIFNMVPGVQALPLQMFFEEGIDQLTVTITVA